MIIANANPINSSFEQLETLMGYLRRFRGNDHGIINGRLAVLLQTYGFNDRPYTFDNVNLVVEPNELPKLEFTIFHSGEPYLFHLFFKDATCETYGKFVVTK